MAPFHSILWSRSRLNIAFSPVQGLYENESKWHFLPVHLLGLAWKYRTVRSTVLQYSSNEMGSSDVSGWYASLGAPTSSNSTLQSAVQSGISVLLGPPARAHYLWKFQRLNPRKEPIVTFVTLVRHSTSYAKRRLVGVARRACVFDGRPMLDCSLAWVMLVVTCWSRSNQRHAMHRQTRDRERIVIMIWYNGWKGW